MQEGVLAFAPPGHVRRYAGLPSPAASRRPRSPFWLGACQSLGEEALNLLFEKHRLNRIA